MGHCGYLKLGVLAQRRSPASKIGLLIERRARRLAE